MTVLAPAAALAALEPRWERHHAASPTCRALAEVGRYAHVDLVLFDGEFVPRPRGWTDGPDAFELEVGTGAVGGARGCAGTAAVNRPARRAARALPA